MTTDDTPYPSWRERKKDRTRGKLTEIAHNLFLRQGYEATTLEQIAGEAKVTVRTVLRYFGSKLRLALAPQYDHVDEFRARLQAPDREIDTLSCWRQHVEKIANSLTDAREVARHQKFVENVPVLLVGLLEVRQAYEDALEAALAQDAGVDPETDLHSRLLAAMLLAGNSSVIRQWIAGGKVENLRDVLLSVVDFAIENFPARVTPKV